MLLLLLFFPTGLIAEVPALLSYQGRVAVRTKAFEGTGQFKLALVNSGASQLFWRNAPDANSDGEPDQAISVAVTKGLYSILIGDTRLPNMASLPASVFSNSEVYLRVWFNDGVSGFQLLSPDTRIASVGYAMTAGSVSDGAVSSAKLDAALAATISSLTDQVSALTTRLQQVENSTQGGTIAISTEPRDAGLLAGGYLPFSSTAEHGWVNGPVEGVPGARTGHTAIWTGEELLVWGGYLGADIYANSGGRFHPGRNLWSQMTTFGAPSARESQSAIWTGTEMIVWGGLGSVGYVDTGARYQPSAQMWSAVSTVNAPSARSGHSSVWTGARMIVWGGRGADGLASGGAIYDPAANDWTALTADGAPQARHSATAVWTGERMLIWGGVGEEGALNSGKRLRMDGAGTSYVWEGMASNGTPTARSGHTAVWTGSRMIIWGGRDGGTFFGDGALYDPAADGWSPMPTEGAPTPRSGQVAVWTGSEMLVFGGRDGTGALNTGGAFDPVKNRWRALNANGNPVGRTAAEAVWSGTELIVFGGHANGQAVSALQRLNPQPVWHFYRKL